ncbi:MAG TPA: prepilin-type N-terminal cleavage/methylation domain-containing protein, partial [Nitrospirae bacterium]|nr:prepilin-type N-terminal cleavage/methylation domain-containing protein [Nitrospirota bacterium]
MRIITNTGKTGIYANRGLTLIEVLFVIMIMAVLMIPLASQFRGVRVAWDTGNKRSDLFQNARIGFDKMLRELKAAKQIISVTTAGDIVGRIEFIDKDDNTAIFERFLNGGKYWLGYTTDGSSPNAVGDILAGPINTMKFTSYEEDSITATTKRRAIKSVAIEMEVASDEGGINPETFAGRVIMEKELITLSINEINYNPSYADRRYEYVELYNFGAAPIDVNGWLFIEDTTDTLQGDNLWGDGSTVIPAGGYAIITDTDTQAYTEMTILNGGFERGGGAALSVWNRSVGWVRQNGGHTGRRRIRKRGAGTMWQQISIPAVANRAFFSFWERQNGQQLIVTVRDTLFNVLMTVYDGPMSGGTWTQHTADLSAYIGSTIRIYFQTFGPVANSNQYRLDDITLALHDTWLSVGDTEIGNRLGNNTETLTLQIPGANGQVVDSVLYDDSWGGDGNGNTIERVDSEDDSNDPLNWAESILFF